MPVPMWQSWSESGRIAAPTLLKVPVEDVIPTTNHLESFNAILKRKYIRLWLHSGHRLHFDVLIILLVTRILPDLFACQLSRRNHCIWVSEHFKEAAGGLDLQVLQERIQAERKDLENKARRVCWWEDDLKRQTLGGTLVSSIREHVFQGADDSEHFYTFHAIALGELEDEDEISLTVEDSPKSNTFGNNQKAIDIQKRHRLEHDVSRILPTLHGIENILSDKLPLPHSPIIKEFEQVLKATLAKIAELRMEFIAQIRDPQMIYTKNQTSRKRKDRKDLRPPSPERRQKRKASHGTM
ncbi:hypothetical protein F5051DRAFT_446446 [Lentinula edodes]|nr:hypothetical protein F5051DRAFT_446446 [Lentinula edodes]